MKKDRKIVELLVTYNNTYTAKKVLNALKKASRYYFLEYETEEDANQEEPIKMFVEGEEIPKTLWEGLGNFGTLRRALEDYSLQEDFTKFIKVDRVFI